MSLSYDSGRGNGPFGFGWALNLPSITRKTDKGLPRYADVEESDTFLLSDAEDLVPELDPDAGWSRVRLIDPPYAPGYQVDRYRPRVEALFARIERWTRIADGDVHWRSVTRDNHTTWYGADSNSRVFDPVAPDHVFSWLICRTYDDKGNAVSYRYAEEDGTGVDTGQAHERHRGAAERTANRYLKRIRYGNRIPAPGATLTMADLPDLGWMFDVVLDYGEHDPVTPTPGDPGDWPGRDDPFSSYRAGFEVRTYRLCRRVLMFHQFPSEPGIGADCLVRSVDFGYSPGGAVGMFLTTVTQRGYRRNEAGPGYLVRALPQVDLHYRPAVLRDQVIEVDRASLANLPAGLSADRHQLVDLDGEGISGILAQQDGSWFYKANLGGARFGPLRPVPTLPAVAATPAGATQLLDLAGDGQLDVVAFGGPTPGFYERTPDGAWTAFRRFALLPTVDWADPNLRFVDLDGDGHADLVLTEHDAIAWYPSLAEDGFGSSRRVVKPLDEADGPRLVFADGSGSIHLADLSGDGLSDLVRVRNGEVCYWPNLGYGRFGRKVVMDHAPWFDRDEMFDPKQLRLADVDGSGVADLLYLGADAVRVYFNQSGNAWSDPVELGVVLDADARASAQTVDLLGDGTTCLVWSLPGPSEAGRSIRYVSLLGGEKPHLLVRVDNNLGAETHIRYASSTAFYLADKAAGRPWLTRLAFPVQVVERVETHDRISRNRFVSRYAYHHGFFDTKEREFRGFGLVEQWDSEEIAVLVADPVMAEATNVDPVSHVPPVLTRTWYHTGAFVDEGATISRRFEQEYWQEPALTEEQHHAMLLDDTPWSTVIRRLDGSAEPYSPSAVELREACRALKGSILRQEVYAHDGTEEADRPYLVAERNYEVEFVQPLGGNRHAVCLNRSREAVTLQYERRLYDIDQSGTTARRSDPRVSHELTLDVDGWGNVLRSAAVVYGRRFPDADLNPMLDPPVREAVRQAQVAPHATLTVNGYTNPITEGPHHRAPQPAETSRYELINVIQLGGAGWITLNQLRERVDAASDGAHDLPFADTWSAGAVTDQPYRRLVERTRTVYRRDDLAGPLPAGTIEPLGLPYDSYRLALTPDLLTKAFQREGVNLLPDSAAVLGPEGGYVGLDGAWWMPAGRVFYSAGPEDDGAMELAEAQAHFFLPRRFSDPFGQITTITYDAHDLLTLSTVDPIGNVVSAGERAADGTVAPGGHDYRVLSPSIVSDPNRNRAAVAFDALGLVVATAVMGKPEEDLGDRLEGFDPDPSEAAILAELADPLTVAPAMLGRATTRLIYDLFGYARTKADPQPQPAVVHTISREVHDASLAPGAASPVRHRLAYSDGLGREIQAKAPAEPGPLTPGQPAVSPRWSGTGWMVFNNKGKPVREYEPFFSTTHRFEFAKAVGVSPVICYDPMDRVVATLAPDGTYSKIVIDPWLQSTWDGGDTVLLDPRTDPDVQGFLGKHLATLPGWQTWHARRTGGALGASEQAAAAKSEMYSSTPVMAYMDSMGRSVLTVGHNRFAQAGTGTVVDELYPTRVVFDIEGAQREVVDARAVTVLRQEYDVAGRLLRTWSSDGGERWLLPDVGGLTVRRWDGRGYRARHRYDAARRPSQIWVQSPDPGAAEALVELLHYGEARPGAETWNLRARPHLTFDGSGLAVAERHDFKGNVLSSRRQLAREYQNTVDWSVLSGLDLVSAETAAAPLLEPETFIVGAEFDALDRPVLQMLPDTSAVRPGYNEAGLLETISVRLPGDPVDTPFVAALAYTAKAQREQIDYANGVITTYTYDEETMRLRRLLTRRGAETLQDLSYVYDAVGKISEVVDAAQPTIFFAGQVVPPSTSYVNDAIGRLVAATGREHASIGVQPDHDEPGPAPLPHPNDTQAVRAYTQRYSYDQVGNILAIVHQSGAGSFTRNYSYGAESNRLLGHSLAGTVGTVSFTHDTHGNMTSMPHLSGLTWNHQDHLSSVDLGGGGTAYYTYDAVGQRLRKVLQRQGGLVEERIYLGGYEVHRRRLNGTLTFERSTVHVTDDKRRVALIETTTLDSSPPSSSVRIRYQIANHLGSTGLELNEVAALISYEEYHPYGTTSLWLHEGAAEVSERRYRYTGKEKDDETSLYYYGARYYACWLGRWISADPAGLTDGVNRYCYVSGDPVAKVDPSGAEGRTVTIQFAPISSYVGKPSTFSYPKLTFPPTAASSFFLAQSVLPPPPRKPPEPPAPPPGPPSHKAPPPGGDPRSAKEQAAEAKRERNLESLKKPMEEPLSDPVTLTLRIVAINGINVEKKRLNPDPPAAPTASSIPGGPAPMAFELRNPSKDMGEGFIVPMVKGAGLGSSDMVSFAMYAVPGGWAAGLLPTESVLGAFKDVTIHTGKVPLEFSVDKFPSVASLGSPYAGGQLKLGVGFGIQSTGEIALESDEVFNTSGVTYAKSAQRLAKPEKANTVFIGVFVGGAGPDPTADPWTYPPEPAPVFDASGAPTASGAKTQVLNPAFASGVLFKGTF
jgi:RHS repeat-associated protein